MQSVVLLILLAGLATFLLKLGFMPRWWRLAWLLLTAIAVGLSWPLAAAQSSTQIADFLASPTLMADAAALCTLEVALTVAFCLSAMADPSHKRSTRLFRHLLLLFPGIIAYLALFSLLTWLLFQLPGIPFSRTSWLMAASLLLLLPLLSRGLLWLLPDHSLRLELLFLLALLIGGLAIVATVNGRTAVVGQTAVEWPQLLGLLLIVGLGTLVGLTLRKIKPPKNNP
ncbi:MAG: hypothetical protein IJU19_03465 [Bacteroidales bacterium]|nr:hypothetical protein [Bacteroidales bacterium]